MENLEDNNFYVAYKINGKNYGGRVPFTKKDFVNKAQDLFVTSLIYLKANQEGIVTEEDKISDPDKFTEIVKEIRSKI